MIFRRSTVPNAFKAAKRFIQALFSQNPVIATGDVIDSRDALCAPCVYNASGQCTHCTCLISLKTLMATESCPIGRWGKQTGFSTGL